MIYTENLQLPILEDTDNFSNIFSQGNTISEKMEEFGTTNNTTLENVKSRLGVVESTIEEVQNENSTQNTNISNLRTDLEDVKNDVTVLEDKIKKVEFTENGEVKTGELHTVKLELTPTYNENVYNVSEYTESEPEQKTRISIGVSSSYAIINLTNLLGIRSVDDIDILSCSSYAKGYYNYTNYTTNPRPLQIRTLAVVTPSGESSIKLELNGNDIDVVRQTYTNVSGGIGTWNPTSGASAQKGKVTVLLQAIIYK